MLIYECYNLSVRVDCFSFGFQDLFFMVCYLVLDLGGLIYVDGFKSFFWFFGFRLGLVNGSVGYQQKIFRWQENGGRYLLFQFFFCWVFDKCVLNLVRGYSFCQVDFLQSCFFRLCDYQLLCLEVIIVFEVVNFGGMVLFFVIFFKLCLYILSSFFC